MRGRRGSFNEAHSVGPARDRGGGLRGRAPLRMTLARARRRRDPVRSHRGRLDARRWPVTKDGKSLYWAGLNKAKRSIAVNTKSPEGKELITVPFTAPGEGRGIYLTNFPTSGWLGYDNLRKRRPDLIMMNVTGNPDGSSAVDYTLNCAVGFPFVTGPPHGDQPVNPVNHVLPAWDAITGVTAVLGIVAAERQRRLTGSGQYIRLPLADVAFAMTGNLGYIAEVEVNDADRRSTGNYLYGRWTRLRDKGRPDRLRGRRHDQTLAGSARRPGRPPGSR